MEFFWAWTTYNDLLVDPNNSTILATGTMYHLIYLSIYHKSLDYLVIYVAVLISADLFGNFIEYLWYYIVNHSIHRAKSITADSLNFCVFVSNSMANDYFLKQLSKKNTITWKFFPFLTRGKKGTQIYIKKTKNFHQV